MSQYIITRTIILYKPLCFTGKCIFTSGKNDMCDLTTYPKQIRKDCISWEAKRGKLTNPVLLWTNFVGYQKLSCPTRAQILSFSNSGSNVPFPSHSLFLLNPKPISYSLSQTLNPSPLQSLSPSQFHSSHPTSLLTPPPSPPRIMTHKDQPAPVPLFSLTKNTTSTIVVFSHEYQHQSLTR